MTVYKIGLKHTVWFTSDLHSVPFPRQTAISVENRKIFPPLVFCVPAEGVPLGIWYQCWGVKKLE